MKDVLRIAIVDPNDGTATELRGVLLGMDAVWLEAECSRYEFFLDVIQQSSPASSSSRWIPTSTRPCG